MFTGKIYAEWMRETQEEKIRGILEHIRPRGRILDIGCGAGVLEEYRPNIYSTDVDLDNLRRVKATKVLADGDRLPFKFRSFDTIFCIDTIHLLRDEREIHRVLSDDGVGVISTFCNEYNKVEKLEELKDRFRGWEIEGEFIVGKEELDAVILCRKRYNFDLLVSCRWGTFRQAREEVAGILSRLGDEGPEIRPTIARGIIGVKTDLDPREVIRKIRVLYEQGSWPLQFAVKWVPIDVWVYSDLASMEEAVYGLKKKIRPGEKWRMTVEKRRYTRYHKIEIIRDLAELIDEKVDLSHPDKILRVDILGKYAGLSVLEPRDIFSIMKF
ncbi:MAG: methyltransferase domain-containing protein [Candidatus Hydrothermarchaeales archaeon]